MNEIEDLMNSRCGTFYLNEDKTYRPCTYGEWTQQLKYMRETKTKHVASTDVNGYWVSTVWLGLDHNAHGGPPLLFETMVFEGRNSRMEEYCCRYSTWKEAESGHKEAVQWAKDAVMTKIKQSDWKAIEAIEMRIDLYHSGDLTDYEALKDIALILKQWGYLNE